MTGPLRQRPGAAAKRSHLVALVLLLLMPCIVVAGPAIAKKTMVLSGRVVDIDGKTVAGAEIFLYDSVTIRRPADFISARTGADGLFRITLPRRKFWAVARVRSGERFGPLLPGDRLSGEPLILEPDETSDMQQDFIVVDIQEAARQKEKVSADFLRVMGQIVDQQGNPVRDAYVFAAMERTVRGIPEYVSAWTDKDGGYTLYLPPGHYFLGAGGVFPPAQGTTADSELSLGAEKKIINKNILIPPDRLPQAPLQDKLFPQDTPKISD